MSQPLLPTRVWDLPTRLFHWVLATCVIASIVSAQIGGNAMVWHFRLGYVVFTLLAFRLVWGLIGGHWSRFARFIYAPQTVLRYLRGQSRDDEHHEVGHSPLGAFSVFGLLGILAVQVATGLVADDEIANTGPLIKFVSGAVSGKATSWHKTWGQWIIISLIVLHVVAIVFYLVGRKRNLVKPMILGDKDLPSGTPASVDHWGVRGVALVVITLCGAGVAWLVSLGG
ncbi:cytochrome b/b6 domain-containing protein [Piscinibacter terrae]|uniref:Cytochrome B n=1 Tax=Piscinibacter terrae TaxID=2496871 RepID=A0A3N7HPJ0_9BURK|nr:cytochrome b/b6 domain-containing protein [Albitalea terrae]RQP24117.1 cytochrome B [Albitalea terrae]